MSSYVPLGFPLGIHSLIAFFGLPRPVCLIPHFHGLFTNFIGLSRPNNLILILGVHGPAINPLLSLFALPWACGGPFSLFYLILCPWDSLSVFPDFFEPTCFFKTHLFICWACDSLFLPLRPNEFFAIYLVNSLWPSLLGFSVCLGFYKWPSTNFIIDVSQNRHIMSWEENFLKSLPRKMIIGFFTLILSIATDY